MLEHRRAALRAEPERADALAQLDRSRAVAESEADEAMHAARDPTPRSMIENRRHARARYRRRRNVHGRGARLRRRDPDREGADARASGGARSSPLPRRRRRRRRAASRTGRRSRRTRSSNGAARGPRSSTNEGFEHVLHLRRQTRAHLYRPCAEHPPPLVPLERCVGVRGRTGPDGELVPLDLEHAARRSRPRRSPSRCSSHSATASSERRGGERAAAPLPGRARRRVARGRAGVPRVRARVDDGDRRLPRARCSRATSARSPEPAASRRSPDAARHALVGRSRDARRGRGARRVRAALRTGGGRRRRRRGSPRSPGFANALSFDMGGTSTDVCAIVDGEARREHERLVGGLPVRLPTLAVHTVGAGGGSIVRLDEGGALRVGPESAGAEPGPACYGRGGTTRRRSPTRTCSSGGLPTTLPGGIELDRGAARARARGHRPGRRDRRRQRRDGARAARRLRRAGSRPARLRARRLRRRRARCTPARSAEELGMTHGARSRRRRRPLGARPRCRRRATGHRADLRRAARRRGRAPRRRRGRPALRRASRSSSTVPLGDRLAERVPRRARSALRLRGSRPRDRARRGADGGGATGAATSTVRGPALARARTAGARARRRDRVDPRRLGGRDGLGTGRSSSRRTR
mgnify:CR=1 FL=1